MGRLSGFRYREVVEKLRLHGYQFDRQAAGSHEIWRNRTTGKKVTNPHHAKDMPESTLRAILRETDISVEDFLKA